RECAGPRVGLVGHSLGAVKCLYAAAREAGIRPACVIAVSAPRLAYDAFRSGDSAAEFLETFTRAEQLCAGGEGDTLLEIKMPLSFVITAAGYVEKYGPHAGYDLLRFVDGVNCPVLFTFGGQEVATSPAFRGLPEVLAALPSAHKHAREIIPDADHFYTGKRTELLETVEAWLRRAF